MGCVAEREDSGARTAYGSTGSRAYMPAPMYDSIRRVDSVGLMYGRPGRWAIYGAIVGVGLSMLSLGYTWQWDNRRDLAGLGRGLHAIRGAILLGVLASMGRPVASRGPLCRW